jgi:hypothetical protein
MTSVICVGRPARLRRIESQNPFAVEWKKTMTTSRRKVVLVGVRAAALVTIQ